MQHTQERQIHRQIERKKIKIQGQIQRQMKRQRETNTKTRQGQVKEARRRGECCQEVMLTMAGGKSK